MSEYVNENADIFDDTPKKQNIFVRILKWIGVGIILLICVLLFYRCVTSTNHPIVKKVLVDDEILQSYNADPDGFAVEQYGMQSPWVDVKQGRLLEFNYLYYIPSVNKLQFSIKYNEDIVSDTQSEMPLRLRLEDDEGNEYQDYFFETAQRERYKYVRVCFNDIELIKDGEVDEYGFPVRNKYKLYIEFETPAEDASTETYELKFDIYDGKNVFKDVEFEIE